MLAGVCCTGCARKSMNTTGTPAFSSSFTSPLWRPGPWPPRPKIAMSGRVETLCSELTLSSDVRPITGMRSMAGKRWR